MGALPAQDPGAGESGRRDVVSHARLVAPADDAPGGTQPAGEERVLSPGGAEGLVETQPLPAHKTQVQQQAVGGRHRTDRASGPGLAHEELPLSHPLLRLDLVDRDDGPGHRLATGRGSHPHEGSEPAGFGFLIVVDEDQQVALGGLIEGAVAHRRHTGALLDNVAHTHVPRLHRPVRRGAHHHCGIGSRGEGGLARRAPRVVVDDEDLDVGDDLATGLLHGLPQNPADGPLQVLGASEGGDGDRQPAHAAFLPVCRPPRRLRGRPYSRTCIPSAPMTMPSPPREETS